MDRIGIDIIIPIYNAYNELLTCVNSIKKWTDLSKHRLILINDCSSDKRIVPYLEEMANASCTVIYNDRNMGFSANINIGMAQSEDRDVLLLNSDTVVTRNWVEKLLDCAYSNPWIATVTPLSNNATLCSVPEFCMENKLPNGYTVDEYAELVEKASLRKYPEIPVAHGFCMFIKREVINIIGNFDAAAFEKGYGEENDFCYRATEAGYHHVMCDDTFILHSGTSSFISKDKRKYMAEHEKVLDERYPALMQDVRIHCRDNPTSIISDNIRIRTALENCSRRKTILYLVQSDFREDACDHIGGTQLHVKDLTNGLRRQYNIVVAARNDRYLNVTLYTADREMLFQFYIGARKSFERFRSVEFAELYGRILDAFKVDVIHVHHTSGLTLELYYEAEKRLLPVFASLHDYYYLCPNVTLLDRKKQACSGHKQRDCKECLKKQQGIAETVDYINIWKKHHHGALLLCKKIFVPSQSARQIIENCYPDLKDRLMVVEHGIDQKREIKEKEPEKRKRNSDHKTFRVAFLGAINEAKGFQLAWELIKKGNSEIDWYLFGYFEKNVPELNKRNNFYNMGPYNREALPFLMEENEIDLVCILSICAETFCYTLSEAVAAGVPVLVTDLGALGERVRNMGCGWVVSADASGDDVLQRIISLRENEEDYQSKLDNVRKLKLKTNKEMCQEYSRIYQTVFSERDRNRQRQIDNEWLIRGYLRLEDRKDSCIQIQNRLAEAERQLVEIQQSFTYKVVLKLVSLPVPFRHQIKKALTGAYRVFRK